MQFKKERLILFILPLICILLVDPRGEFPLNDDWAYTLAAKYFAETSHLALSTHGAMSLVWQVIYSGGLLKILGFSFTSLRILTLVIAMLNNQIFFSIFNKLSKNSTLSLIAVLAVFFNPIYFNMAFTFMTEVHFLFWFGLSIWCILNEKFWLASLFAALSFLIRQHGILIPVAQILALLYLKFKEGRLTYIKEFLQILLLPLVAFFIYQYWSNHIHGVAPSYLRKFELLKDFGAVQFGLNFFGSLSYLSWFLFPIILIYSWENLQRRKWLISIVAVAFTCIIIQKLLPQNFGAVLSPVPRPYRIQMPYLSNILYNFGLGPITLTDVYKGGEPTPNGIPAVFWEFITAWVWASIAGFVMLFSKAIKSKKEPFIVFCFILLSMLVALEIVISPKKDGGLFDRHLLNYLIPATAIFLSFNVKLTKKKIFASCSYLLLAAFFCIAGTHDYLAWNKARWDGARLLMNELNVPPNKIDGGFEFNGWYLSDTFSPQKNNFTYTENKHLKMNWWMVEDEYRIFFSTNSAFFKGYSVFREMPYYSWLKFKPMSIIIGKKG